MNDDRDYEDREEEVFEKADSVSTLASEREKTREMEEKEEHTLSFLNDREVEEIQSRWSKIQTQFVDEPHTSVDRAESLIEEVVNQFIQTFKNERDMLDSFKDSGDEISTEDLRVALMRYRAFLHRLLSLERV